MDQPVRNCEDYSALYNHDQASEILRFPTPIVPGVTCAFVDNYYGGDSMCGIAEYAFRTGTETGSEEWISISGWAHTSEASADHVSGEFFIVGADGDALVEGTFNATTVLSGC